MCRTSSDISALKNIRENNQINLLSQTFMDALNCLFVLVVAVSYQVKSLRFNIQALLMCCVLNQVKRKFIKIGRQNGTSE